MDYTATSERKVGHSARSWRTKQVKCSHFLLTTGAGVVIKQCAKLIVKHRTSDFLLNNMLSALSKGITGALAGLGTKARTWRFGAGLSGLGGELAPRPSLKTIKGYLTGLK